MTVRLRPHHLLCMLTYVGAGYSPAFTANMDRVVARIGRREPVEIVAGPDAICAPICGSRAAHCHRPKVRLRDRRAAVAATKLLGTEIRPGTRLTLGPREIAKLRRAFASGRARAACTGCPWSALCTSVAGRAWRDARLAPPPH